MPKSMSRFRPKTRPMTPELAAKAKVLLSQGLYQHQVAAALGVNQGRVSEVANGKRFATTDSLNEDVVVEQYELFAAAQQSMEDNSHVL